MPQASPSTENCLYLGKKKAVSAMAIISMRCGKKLPGELSVSNVPEIGFRDRYASGKTANFFLQPEKQISIGTCEFGGMQNHAFEIVVPH